MLYVIKSYFLGSSEVCAPLISGLTRVKKREKAKRLEEVVEVISVSLIFVIRGFSDAH